MCTTCTMQREIIDAPMKIEAGEPKHPDFLIEMLKNLLASSSVSFPILQQLAWSIAPKDLLATSGSEPPTQSVKLSLSSSKFHILLVAVLIRNSTADVQMACTSCTYLYMSVPAADLPTPQPLSLLPSKPGQALQHGSSRQGTELAACSGIARHCIKFTHCNFRTRVCYCHGLKYDQQTACTRNRL